MRALFIFPVGGDVASADIQHHNFVLAPSGFLAALGHLLAVSHGPRRFTAVRTSVVDAAELQAGQLRLAGATLPVSVHVTLHALLRTRLLLRARLVVCTERN